MDFNQFKVWFATSPIASFLRVALALFIAQAMADFVKVGSFDFTNLNTWVISALASAVPGLLRWLNPADPAFGNSKGG
jgi:hypothetical protein